MKEINISVKKLRDCPGLAENAARWFASKWGIPPEAYRESIQQCIIQKSGIPQWYVLQGKDGDIIAGAGIIDNDFHDRKDLTPNLCALFVEKEHRKCGIARKILDFARQDMCRMGYETLYLVTDHTEFYEKCGWSFLTMVRGEDDIMERMYAVHTSDCRLVL